MELHFGVIDLPYEQPQKVRPGKPASDGKTTGDVAEILEAKYHVMEIFFEIHKDEIIAALEDSLGGDFENLMMGKVPGSNSFAAAEEQIAKLFRNFISAREMERLGYPGVPTQAALDGVNHRLKHPYAKDNPRRSSFDDSGMYMAAFRAWLDH